MKLPTLHGLTLALSVAGLISADGRAATWPKPVEACNQNSLGQVSYVVYENYTPGQDLLLTYYCNGFKWQLVATCELQNANCGPY